jgi:hypothetical protein
MLSGTQNLFDSDLTLSGAFLLHVKTMKPGVRTFSTFFFAFTACIDYSLRLEARAREIPISTANETKASETHLSIVDELEKASSAIVSNPQPGEYTWLEQSYVEKSGGSIGEDDPRWSDTNSRERIHN